MDAYTPALLELGLKVMIGKGQRSEEVVKSMVENGAVYLAAVGGAGALLSKCIKKAEVIAFEDLGTEAIHRLYVENFTTIVLSMQRGIVFIIIQLWDKADNLVPITEKIPV